MRKRTILSVAVAGALGAGFSPMVFGQESNVEVYGKLYPEFTIAKSSGATPAGTAVSGLSPAATGLDFKSRNSVDASNSRLGFRGKEDLGNGLRTIWQIEQKATIDTGASGSLANRDSFVGLDKSGFGTVRLGNMTTIYKDLREPIRFLGIESGNFVSSAGVHSSTPWGNKNVFHVRQPNSIDYHSPIFGGVQLAAGYSPDEIRKISPGAANLNAYLESFGVKYESGPLYLTLAHEIHNDFFGYSSTTGVPAATANATTGAGNIHSKDTATRAVAGLTFGPTRVSLMISSLEYQETGSARAATGFDNYKNKTWSLAWEQTWGGPWKTVVQYSSASAGTCGLAGGGACSTSGLNGNMLAVGGQYSFSKRTGLFVLYDKLTNGISAVYNNTANVTTISPGSDITHYAVGIQHSF
jgi:predicted porin